MGCGGDSRQRLWSSTVRARANRPQAPSQDGTVGACAAKPIVHRGGNGVHGPTCDLAQRAVCQLPARRGSRKHHPDTSTALSAPQRRRPARCREPPNPDPTAAGPIATAEHRARKCCRMWPGCCLSSARRRHGGRSMSLVKARSPSASPELWTISAARTSICVSAASTRSNASPTTRRLTATPSSTSWVPSSTTTRPAQSEPPADHNTPPRPWTGTCHGCVCALRTFRLRWASWAAARHLETPRSSTCRGYLRSVALRGAHLTGAKLRHANLARAVLAGVWLGDSDFTEADLRQSFLENTRLSRADLSNACLQGANLRGADLSGANLCGANLSGTILDGTMLTGAQADATTIWPPEIDAEAHRALGITETASN